MQNKKVIALAAIFLLALNFLWCNKQEIKDYLRPPKQYSPGTIPTTIPVNEVKPIKADTARKAVPEKIRVQIKPDTARRHKVERQTIEIGTIITRDYVLSQTIDTAGHIIEKLIPILETDEVKIDEEGKIEIVHNKKAELWNKVKKTTKKAVAVLVIIGAVAIAVKK